MQSRWKIFAAAAVAALLIHPAFAQDATSADTQQKLQQLEQKLADQQKEIEALKWSSSQAVAAAPVKAEADKDAPLFFKLGGAKFTPGGWVDFTSIYRTTDVGSGFTTALASIPYNNTFQGGLSENRLTAGNSRLSLRADEAVGKTKVYGYAEIDFNGTPPGNVYETTNSDVTRLRVIYVNLNKGKWELTAGQDWSLLTPNRVGLSSLPSETYNTLDIDTAYNAGIVYARQPQIRAVYHFSPSVAFGLSAETSQQFTGTAVAFPSVFNASYTSEVDESSSAGGQIATPNLHPDVIAKLALEHKFGQKLWHVEVAGLLTPITLTTPVAVTGTATANDRREGSGASVNTNLEVFRGLHLIANGFWSDGGGRYTGALGPSFAVAQWGATTAPFTIQKVHTGAGLGGFEYQATKNTVASLVYGLDYFSRISSVDPSGTHPTVGYGFAGSANSNNRTIQEGSFATVTNIYRKPSFGALQLITEFSYIERTPWAVATGKPKNAHVFENYLDIRYVLP
jgi:hypothetical protein